jgi:predicted nucleotidyltransferase
MSLKRANTIRHLQEHRTALDSFGIKSLSLFGSVARDEAGEHSDLDVLVEFEGQVTFDRYMDLKFYLEDLLDVSVDLVTQKMLRSEIKATVEQELVRVA